MVHGSCGPYNKNSPCMKNGSCSKFYPKEFRQRTLIDEAGFPKYRHTDNGQTVKKRECVLDNKLIVPYNPELLLKFGCHINVEYTCQTSSIKYLFKYIHKGNDRVTATLYNAGDPSEATQVVDKIRNYYGCRYISDEQPVVYGETSNVNDIIKRAISHKSNVLGWMAANMSYPYAQSLTYAEFSTKFVWKDDASKWFPRKQASQLEELTMSDDEIKQLCLIDIDKILHSYGKTLKDYPLMPLATEVDNSLLTERIIREELNFNRDDLKKNTSDMLAIATLEQKYAFDKIVKAVYCDEGSFFFVYGHGDTGKIFLWNFVSAEIRSRGDIVLNVASSGIASLLLPNGRKAHSRFKILLNITEDSVVTSNLAFDEFVHFSYPNILDNISSKDFLKQELYWLPHWTSLKSINCSGLPPHKLILNVGVPVMLLRNIDQSSGLCNDTRLQVRKPGNHVIECEVLTGNNVGHIALIPRMNNVPTNETVLVRFQ
ncbi:uncharacterized protein LOC107626977 [Arachis ipaensis]|uniref:uncharacterized protein LOC107626977 n=1 Tax=Arachis ipaensis TaxID=130454 RepID=UPI0007AF173D|nr:uncharacterized protein LOC107626977 [Arachis ipaensis]